MKNKIITVLGALILVSCDGQSPSKIETKTLGVFNWIVNHELPKGVPATGSFHEITKQPDGKYFAKIGSILVILNVDGRQISQGFHEIAKQSDGKYIARMGAATVLLDSDGRQISQCFQNITKQKDGQYFATSESVTALLNSDGRQISQLFQEIKQTNSGYSAKLGNIQYTLDNTGAVKSVNPIN